VTPSEAWPSDDMEMENASDFCNASCCSFGIACFLTRFYILPTYIFEDGYMFGYDLSMADPMEEN
jgi:hypothetical protein